jgi:hypothetical protein
MASLSSLGAVPHTNPTVPTPSTARPAVLPAGAYAARLGVPALAPVILFGPKHLRRATTVNRSRLGLQSASLVAVSVGN